MITLIHESEQAYDLQRRNFLTSHALADFRACPLLYRQKQIGLVPHEDSDAFLVGRALHTLALQGRSVYDATYAIGGPINERTGRPFGRDTKAFAEWALGCGKPVLSIDQADLVEQMAKSVREHPLASDLLRDGVAEAVARAEYCGMACQARVDWLATDGRLCDLKSADSLTFFEHDARRYNYVYQMAFYRALLREVGIPVASVMLIAVEKNPPYRCGVWRVDDQTLDMAARENVASINRLAVCREQDSWPTLFEALRHIDYL